MTDISEEAAVAAAEFELKSGQKLGFNDIYEILDNDETAVKARRVGGRPGGVRGSLVPRRATDSPSA
jgi:hypothetical protein